MTAETNQISKFDQPWISSFIHCFQITLFIVAPVLCWVYLRRHSHQFALVAKNLKILKIFLIVSILNWFTLYVSLIMYLCKRFKSCFFFQYFSTSLLVCISLDHSYQIWHLKLNEHFAKTFFFWIVSIKR